VRIPGDAVTTTETHITYETFGAIGDGVADDLPAICKAHAHANEHGLPVVARPDATYHLGSQALTVIIATDTDWNTARFMIDDTVVDDHKKPLFVVRSQLPPVTFAITTLTRDQKALDLRPTQACFVVVENDERRVYIRRGLNQNNGVPQHDAFILHPDGRIEGDIDWEYPRISRVEAHQIDDRQLVVKGGIFTTIANKMVQKNGYNYWGRNIEIERSNTVIDGLTHYVVGETAVGHPYRGFLSASTCANVTFRDCFVTGHKIYQTIGAAGAPVSMGSYDLHANNIVNFSMIRCRMNHILDRTRWGVIGSNFCKNILLEDCVLSRMDTHMGVSGRYDIRNCVLGHMGLNAIGRGVLRIEGSTLHGPTLASFRGDYGSTWEGDVEIVNCRWTPSCGDRVWPHMFATTNDGTHDFGYPCFMPRSVTLDGVFIDDANTPPDYSGVYVFTNPDGQDRDGVMPAQSFPYRRNQEVTLRKVTTASGKEPQISPHAELNALVKVQRIS
jgi:hypothetical protein